MREQRVRESIHQANESGVSLLFTDLELAATMLERAESAQDDETRHRNRENVEKACASVHHFMGKLRLSDDQARMLNQKLEALQARLSKLQAP